MHGAPSGPYYGPGNRWVDHPRERPGRRVEVVENDEIVFRDMVGMVGTLSHRNGAGYLVYFDDYIDLNAPLSVLRFLPTIEGNRDDDHLFVQRNRIA